MALRYEKAKGVVRGTIPPCFRGDKRPTVSIEVAGLKYPSKRQADANRLAAAWNCCDGLSTAQLEALGPGGVLALLTLVAEMSVAGCGGSEQSVGSKQREYHDAVSRAQAFFARHDIPGVPDLLSDA